MSAADPLADEELVRAAQSGNPQAREALVDRFYPAVHALALRLLGDRWEVRDAAQETFLRAFAALDGFDAARPFTPWLFAIAANFARDRFRRRRPAAALESADESDLATNIPESLPGQSAEDLARVLEAVDRLAFDLKTVVLLHFQQDCSHSEIAQALGVHRQHRAHPAVSRIVGAPEAPGKGTLMKPAIVAILSCSPASDGSSRVRGPSCRRLDPRPSVESHAVPPAAVANPRMHKPNPPTATVGNEVAQKADGRPFANPLRGHPEASPIARALRETKVTLALKSATWGRLAETFLQDANVPIAVDQAIPAEIHMDPSMKDISVASALTYLTEVINAEWELVDQTVVIRKRTQK